MLENLRRKSLVKTYNDPIHQVHFDQVHARYLDSLSIAQHKQKLSKEKIGMSFPKRYFTTPNPKCFTIPIGFWGVVETLGKVKFNMIYCSSGTFVMGHNFQEYNLLKNNVPRLETIERPFLLGETEITQELYEKVMGNNPSKFQNSPQNPVEKVSWQDAILFCNALSKLQGLDECYTKKSNVYYDWACDFSKNGYRLPTEKEWEYAAKAGTNNKYAGTDKDDDIGDYAVYYKNSKIEGEQQTHLVKTKKPNEWGFYDMSGNVLEWCWDKYDPDALDDPDTPANRVYRGGSWLGSNALCLHSAYRSPYSPGDRDDYIGFRVCRSIVN